MSIIQNNAMQNHVFNIDHDLQTTDSPSWRSTALSLSSDDELGAQLLLGHSDDHYICVTLDKKMINGGHVMMNDIFHYYDGYFLMRIFFLHLIWILMGSTWSMMTGIHVEISRRLHFNIS